jgi:ketosteroid isomerase-like protein
MDTAAVATRFATLCKEGRFEQAGDEFWSPDIVSLEAMDGPMARIQGLAAVKQKGEWWSANHEIHDASVEGPFVHGDQFALRFALDVTAKQSGQRMQMTEIGLYTVRDGKVVEERFLYGMG